jgi:hypothetical protein
MRLSTMRQFLPPRRTRLPLHPSRTGGPFATISFAVSIRATGRWTQRDSCGVLRHVAHGAERHAERSWWRIRRQSFETAVLWRTPSEDPTPGARRRRGKRLAVLAPL